MKITKDTTWEHNGLTCRVAFMEYTSGGGHWVGYVTLPKGHQWHGLIEESIPVDVHGGLTFGDFDGDGYRIGFDAAHAGDGWQDEAWAKRETIRLADQCANGPHGVKP